MQKNFLVIYLHSKSAATGPPLSTLFSQYEVNTAKFCSKFNEVTAELDSLILWKVFVLLKDEKKFELLIGKPPISFLIKCLNFNNCLNLNSLLKLTIFKYGYSGLESNFKCVLGTVLSMGIKIKKD